MPLTIPPYRAALLTKADGSPVSTNGDGAAIATERQWYMFWREMAEQINAGSQALDALEDLVTFGNHADRPDGEFIHDGALYVEQDRGSVLYQNQGGTWMYVAGIMYGTLAPDQRPADLGPSADVGFQFRTSTDPARAFAWSGTAWIETTPIRYGTHAQRLAATVANLVSGMLWMETDRGSVIYQNQGGTWLYLTGTMWGTLSPDQRPTDLGVRDAGFDYRSTDPPPREFIWNQTAWVEITNVGGATGLTHPNVVTKVGAAGQIVEGGITDASAANSGKLNVSAAGNVGVGNDLSVLPNSSVNLQNLIVGPATAGAVIGAIFAVGNNGTAGAAVATIGGANYARTGTEKRIAVINIAVDGNVDSGSFQFFTWNSGAVAERFRISANGAITIPNLPSVNPGAGTKQLWFDPADGNRVKYAP